MKYSYAYILRCSDNTYYVGHSDDLDRRIAQHHAGEFEGYTKKRRPVEVMWHESFPTRIEAKAAEEKIKGWSRAKKEALFAGDWRKISELAARQTPYLKKPD